MKEILKIELRIFNDWVPPLGPFPQGRRRRPWVPGVGVGVGCPRGWGWGVGWGWGPWGAFGSKGSAPCRSEKRASREFGGGATLPEIKNWVGGMRFSVYGFLIEKLTFPRSAPLLK